MSEANTHAGLCRERIVRKEATLTYGSHKACWYQITGVSRFWIKHVFSILHNIQENPCGSTSSL